MQLSRKACAAAFAATLFSVLSNALLAQSIPPINQNDQGTVQAQYSIFKGPKVNVLDTEFAGGADPTGVINSDVAIQAAVTYVQGLAANGVNAPTLYFPRGIYQFTQSILMQGANQWFNIEGDGSGVTILNDVSPSSTAIKLLKTSGPAGFGFSHLHLRDFTVQSTGHTSAADLLDIASTSDVDVEDVHFQGTAGICVNLEQAERNSFTNVEMTNCRRSVLLSQNANENYFRNIHITQPGQDQSNWSYNVNAVITGTGNSQTSAIPGNARLVPDYRAAFTASGGQNIHVDSGSIKGTVNQGCLQFFQTNGFSVKHIYCEGYGTPSINPSLQVGGAVVLTHGSSALTTTQTGAVTVDAAIYQPEYFATLTDLQYNGGLAQKYLIAPPDFTPGSGVPSSIGGGVTKGTYEVVAVSAFYGGLPASSANPNGAGNGYITARGLDGTTAQAWPSGWVMGRLHDYADDGDGASEEMHFNSITGVVGSQTDGTSDNTLNTGAWVGSPAQIVAEVLVGPVYDGFTELFTSQGQGGANIVGNYVGPGTHQAGGTLYSLNDEWYGGSTNTAAISGSGVVKSSINGGFFNLSCTPSRQVGGQTLTFPPTVYNNGPGCDYVDVAYPNDPGGTSYALGLFGGDGQILDPVQNVVLEPIDLFYNPNGQPRFGGTTGERFQGAYEIRDFGSNGYPSAQLDVNDVRHGGTVQVNLTNGSGATVTLQVTGGVVTGATVTNGGSGYSGASISITGGGGTGAVLTPVVFNGVIQSVTVNNGGSGYTSSTAPTATVNAVTTKVFEANPTLGASAPVFSTSNNTKMYGFGNTTECDFCTYIASPAVLFGLGQNYGQLTLVSDDNNATDSIAMYINKVPNNTATSTNSDYDFGASVFSLSQSKSLGWSSSATGAGTGGSSPTIQTGLSQPSAGIVSVDTNVPGNAAGTLRAATLQAGSATWTANSGVPSGACANGSLYSNTTGAAGTTFYACISGAWLDVK